MIEPLVILSLSVEVLKEQDFKEFRLEINVDDSWSHLDNGKIEDKNWANDWKMQVVIDISKAVVLFVGDRLNDLVVNILLVLSDSLVMMVEQILQGWIISTFPLG